MVIRKYWIKVVHRAATGTKGVRTLLTPIGVVVFGTFTALFVLGAVFFDQWLGLPSLLPGGARMPMAIPLMAVGAALTAWSGYCFLKVRGTPVPFNPPPAVVDNGPYRIVRNPMLTGVFIFLLGFGVAFDSISLVFFFTPVFVAINYWELREIEEPELVMRLGDDYVAYRRRTPMFIPGRAALKRLLAREHRDL
jgi:protein-S-isoprenylcysteine O-methyltransferase Ste14